MLRSLLPRAPEVAGLLALMLLHDARREARCDAQGRLVVYGGAGGGTMYDDTWRIDVP